MLFIAVMLYIATITRIASTVKCLISPTKQSLFVKIERFPIAPSLLELIFDSDRGGFEYSWRLELEDSDEDHGYFAPSEMIEFCKTINPVLPSIRHLASRDQLSRSYHFFASQVLPP